MFQIAVQALLQPQLLRGYFETRLCVLVDIHFLGCRRLRHADFSFFGSTSTRCPAIDRDSACDVSAGTSGRPDPDASRELPSRMNRLLAGPSVYERATPARKRLQHQRARAPPTEVAREKRATRRVLNSASSQLPRFGTRA